jgi:hypothetical protein
MSETKDALRMMKKSDLQNLKLISQGGSKQVYSCQLPLLSDSKTASACYYCYYQGNDTKKREEFERELSILVQPKLQESGAVLRVYAVPLRPLSVSPSSYLSLLSLRSN